MGNGPHTNAGEEPHATPEGQEEVRNLTEPLDPESLDVALVVLDMDEVRREEEVAALEEEAATRAVARATGDESDTATTLDEPLAALPIVDVHCHIHGVSLSRAKKSIKNFEQHGLFNGNDLAVQKKREAFMKSLRDYYAKPEEKFTARVVKARQFGHWNFKDDPWVAKKILSSTQRFQDATGRHVKGNPVIITPMLLDFGYTPLGTSVASKAAKAKGSGDSMTESEARKEETSDTGIFYFSKSAQTQKRHRFFTRDKGMFEHQIEILHLMAKLWPGQIMPFCPYDPRRPECLDHVKKAMDSQAYVGVKLYARCGWMPYGNAALHGAEVGEMLDKRLDEFYTYVTQNDIPILNHTSPTGHPPDGALVFPWRMTAEGSRAAANPERDEAASYSPVGYPPNHWQKPDRFVKGRSSLQKTIERMRYELTGFGYYCLYDQLTTSPYSWETVLSLYPKLRLCFAHFGSKLGVYANPRYNINSQEAKADCEKLLQKNPMVAGATGPRTFKDYFFKGAVNTRGGEHAREAAETLLAPETEWGDFLDKWAEKYPADWSTKITELVSKYDNVYTDISYITGDGNSMPDIVGPIFQDALEQRAKAGRLFDKLMIGTDWYMTEISGLSPGAFWDLVANACKMDEARLEEMPDGERQKRTKVWEQWATKNALRYLNVKPRLGGAGMEKLVHAYGCTRDELPPWWKTLENFYDNPEPVDPPK